MPKRKLDEHEALRPGWAVEREPQSEPKAKNLNVSGNVGGWVGRATKNSFPNGVPKSSYRPMRKGRWTDQQTLLVPVVCSGAH
jgi:hypothetical protein